MWVFMEIDMIDLIIFAVVIVILGIFLVIPLKRTYSRPSAEGKPPNIRIKSENLTNDDLPQFRSCPKCKSTMTLGDDKAQWNCSHCKYIIFNNNESIDCKITIYGDGVLHMDGVEYEPHIDITE
jgi:ribosomal protein S27AE